MVHCCHNGPQTLQSAIIIFTNYAISANFLVMFFLMPQQIFFLKWKNHSHICISTNVALVHKHCPTLFIWIRIIQATFIFLFIKEWTKNTHIPFKITHVMNSSKYDPFFVHKAEPSDCLLGQKNIFKEKDCHQTKSFPHHQWALASGLHYITGIQLSDFFDFLWFFLIQLSATYMCIGSCEEAQRQLTHLTHVQMFFLCHSCNVSPKNKFCFPQMGP